MLPDREKAGTVGGYDFGMYADVEPAAADEGEREAANVVGKTDLQLEELKRAIHTKLFERVRPEELSQLPEAERRRAICQAVEGMVEQERAPLNAGERIELVQDLLDEILGLGPLEKLLADPTVSDILVNGPYQVYVDREGNLEETSVRFRDEGHLREIIYRIVSRVGRRVDDASPLVDARLPDGSRVNAIIPPLSPRGSALSIRRFGMERLKLKDLLNLRTLAAEMAEVLEAAVRARLNILISGGTGSGKTTLLNVLSSFIPNTERIITVEDAAELQLQQRHVVQLETRPANIEGQGQITTRDLVRNTLRMRPNRILVGECRGPEAWDMLQAMNTGHEGSLTTLHANGPRDALVRLETMLLMAGMDMPLTALRVQIASAIQLIIQVDRLSGGPRRVTAITEVVGIERDVITTQELFVFRQLGVDAAGRAYGQFEATGVRPKFMGRLQAASIELPASVFQERVLMKG